MGGPDIFTRDSTSEGSSIASMRVSLGLSQETLARRACISQKQVQQLESGESGAFYSTSIRNIALKRVLSLLEEDIQEALAKS